ncbi:MAG: aminoacyl-tRNA hydrolase, partial [Paracholeplasma sp.]
MKLIVGLGNPGKDYDKTRHNVGFEVLDLLAKEKNVTFKLDKNFDGLITTYQEGLEKVILLKPTTYMNLSGQSVIKVKNYYKVDLNDILIVVDDINIELAA